MRWQPDRRNYCFVYRRFDRRSRICCGVQERRGRAVGETSLTVPEGLACPMMRRLANVIVVLLLWCGSKGCESMGSSRVSAWEREETTTLTCDELHYFVPTSRRNMHKHYVRRRVAPSFPNPGEGCILAGIVSGFMAMIVCTIWC